MDSKLHAYAPIGRIYDPLLQLAQRVHRAMARRSSIVWTDADGYVFATSTAPAGIFSLHAVVGIYGRETLRSEIESALRLVLRERASRWIVDWKAQPVRLPHHDGGRQPQSLRRSCPRPTGKDRAVAAKIPRPLLVEGNPMLA